MTTELQARPIGRPCAACSGDREAIETALMEGETISSVASAHGLSRTSLRRHLTHHMNVDPTIARGSGLDAVSIVVRVRDVAERARALAEDALDAGNVNAAIRAGDAEIRALAALASMKVKHEEVVDQLDAFKITAAATVRAARRSPEVAEAVAAQLDIIDRRGLAREVREQFSETKSKEIAS